MDHHHLDCCLNKFGTLRVKYTFPHDGERERESKVDNDDG